jgi:DNA-binding LacI/PurR family transcriptional regulator
MATRFPRPRREKVMREEFEKRGLIFIPSQHMPCWDNDREKLDEFLLERLSSPDRPTAWIINGLDALIMMFSTLMILGLRVPQDVSILSMGSDPMLGCFRPAVGHYSSPHRALASAIAGMIRDELISPSEVYIRLETEYVRGGSVGPVSEDT